MVNARWRAVHGRRASHRGRHAAARRGWAACLTRRPARDGEAFMGGEPHTDAGTRRPGSALVARSARLAGARVSPRKAERSLRRVAACWAPELPPVGRVWRCGGRVSGRWCREAERSGTNGRRRDLPLGPAARRLTSPRRCDSRGDDRAAARRSGDGRERGAGRCRRDDQRKQEQGEEGQTLHGHTPRVSGSGCDDYRAAEEDCEGEGAARRFSDSPDVYRHRMIRGR